MTQPTICPTCNNWITGNGHACSSVKPTEWEKKRHTKIRGYFEEVKPFIPKECEASREMRDLEAGIDWARAETLKEVEELVRCMKDLIHTEGNFTEGNIYWDKARELVAKLKGKDGG